MVDLTASFEEVSSSSEELQFSKKKRKKNNGKKKGEEEKGQSPSSFRPVLDPLKMEHIVSRIMNNLDIKSLKTTRQVCSLWNFEASKILLKKSYLFPLKCLTTQKTSRRESKRRRKELEQFVNMSGTGINLKLGTRYLKDTNKSKVIYVLQKLPESLAKRIKEYKFEGAARHPQIADLARILRYLPNVQFVSTKEFDLQNVFTWAELEENDSDDSSESEDENEAEEGIEHQQKMNKTNMEIFLTKLESLKELKVQCGISVFDFGEYMPYHDRLRAITTLSLNNKMTRGENNNLSHFRDFLRIKSPYQWPISHLTFKVTSQLEKSLVRQFFITISITLTNLDIDLRSIPLTEGGELWIDDWYLPIEMPQLVKLEMAGHELVLKQGLAVALQMTQLKKLVIHSGLKNLNKFINGWETCALASGRKLQSLSIQEVEIKGKQTIKDLHLLSGGFWPNLKSLKIGSFSVLLLKYNLPKNWKNLEHLELDLSEMKSKDLELYEKWMTGISSPAVYESPVILVSKKDDDDMDEDEEDDPVFLRDLQNLKSLTFNHYCLPGDFVLHNCIQLLKNLQILKFKDSHVSAKGISELKKSFGDGRISILVDNKYV